MKKISYFAVILVLLTAVSCRQKSGSSGIKVDNFSTGKAGEMILAIDTNYWSKAAVKAIYEVIQQPQPAINQIEPMFDVIQCSNSDYKASFMRHRNIVQFDYNPDYAGNTFEISRNPITSPQILVKIRGNQQDSCLALFLAHQDEIVKAMYANDIARLQNAHRKLNNPVIEKKIKEKFGLSMTIPDGYFVGREEEDFLWLCFRTPKNDRFVMLYKSPRYDLTKENIVAERDRITKAYIQGAVAGAYPLVANIEGYPMAQDLQIRYHNGMELRGLWETVRDKMGGPFYSFTQVSPDSTTCITVDGFVYAPQEEKRDYLREVEAIVKSIQ
ncbi:MAG: DUF4837 family protein [Bacteroidales bacterium]|nr:DUF4837 family protein [Bacteroidales bacterium]